MSHEYAYVTCICHMPRVHLLVCSFGSIEGNGRRRQTAVSSDFLAVSAVATAARSALKRGGVQGRCPDAAPVRRASIHASFSRPACGAGGRGGGEGGRGAHPGCPLCGRGPPFFGGFVVCLFVQSARPRKYCKARSQSWTYNQHRHPVAVTLLWPTLEHASKLEKRRAFAANKMILPLLAAEERFALAGHACKAKEAAKNRTPAEIFPAARGLKGVNLRTTSALVQHIHTPPGAQ